MVIYYTTGYAGTGKSTALLKKLDSLPEKHTIVLAPTHKALQRLLSSYSGNIEFKTIHSLLGLIPSINENAEHINHIDSLSKLDKDIDTYHHIVIDEAGMIAEDHFLDLVSKLEVIEDDSGIDITMYLYLDPYQLLPVKGRQIQTDSATTTNLTTQYRSESPDIVELYTKFVRYMQNPNSDLTTPYSENVLKLDITKFKYGDRMLCYTNEAVGKWNTLIAKHLGVSSIYGGECVVGSDIAVVNKANKPTLQELCMLYESGGLNLQNSQISKKFVSVSLQQLLDFKQIEWAYINDKLTPIIVGINEAYKLKKKIMSSCINNRSNFKHLYTFNRAYVVDYTFCSTVHKSQGSEFENVFIDKEDIQKSIFNSNYSTYARLMYVAISRAMSKLYI